MRLDQDHHVHSTFSDGQASVLEMAQTAAERGLVELGFADHVRVDSDWLPAYIEAVQRAQTRVPGVRLRVGVEAKILDRSGRLDLPELPVGIEQVVIADHQYPGVEDPLHPKVVAQYLSDGLTTPQQVIEDLVESTRRAVLSCPREPIVGHLFSILPKVGIAHGSFSSSLVDPLFEACLERDARLEVDERWRAPGAEVVERALAMGVRVVASTDSHNQRAVGRYRYVRKLAEMYR